MTHIPSLHTVELSLLWGPTRVQFKDKQFKAKQFKDN